MMRMSAIEAAKLVVSSNFSIDNIKFEGFEDVGETSLVQKVNVQRGCQLSEFEDEFHQLDIWAHMSVKHEGKLPDSYRVLNSIVLDYVEDHEKDIKKEINPKLKEYLKSRFPGINTESLDEDFDDYIWEDQVDYYPGVDPDDNRLHFMIELVLEIDEDNEGEE